MEEISPISFFKFYQQNNNFKIIDIRDTIEYDLYHIKNSVNIPYKLLVEKHKLFLNDQMTYFILCKNGDLSFFATKFLSKLGYHVVNVIGGIDHFKGHVITRYK